MAIGKDKIAGTVPSNKSVQLFESIIAKSYERTLSEFDGADLANKTRRAAIMRQLDQIVADTHMDLQAWAVTQIPAFYEAGAFEAAKDMVKGGQAVDMYKNFAAIHQEAIAALVNGTSADIASAMVGMQKMTQNLINTATRDALLQQVAVGNITGDSRKEITKGIMKELKQNGITSLVDKGGKQWDLSTYGRMLARTKLTQAHNNGVAMRLTAEGNDLVIVSDHISACPLCQPWENKVLSVSGKSSKYPSLATAQEAGLFHPNCRHAISPLPNDQEYLENSMVWDANKQEYVPFNGVNNARGVGATPYGKEVTIGKNATVYRAVDSTSGEATMGYGTYFGFEKGNVTRYGKDVRAFRLQEGTKMLQLGNYDGAMKFAEEARKADPEWYKTMALKLEPNDLVAKSITRYAKSLGYDGIIGDDAVFGSVIFDSKLLKELNAAGLYGTTKQTVAATFQKLGKSAGVELSDFQAKFMQDRGVGFTINEKTKSLRKHGLYYFNSNNIELNKYALTKAGRDGQHTFFHELGHAIDNKYTNNAVREINTVEWIKLSQDEKMAVAKNRFVKSYADTVKKYNVTPEEMEDIWRGGSTTREITVTRNGKEATGKIIIGSNSSHLRYVRSKEEVFADGYAQYTMNPKEFKKLAPSMFDYFEKLQKNYE